MPGRARHPRGSCLGVAAPAGCSGRGLAALLAGQEPTKPPPPRLGAARILLAIAALALFGAALLWARTKLAQPRRRSTLLLLPWSTALAVLLLGCFGPPSLSRAFVYPALSPVLLSVGLASGLLLVLQLATARGLGLPAVPALALLTAGVLVPAAAALLLSGWPVLSPPLVPFWSGWASSLLEVSAAALVVLAAATSVMPDAAARSSGPR